MATAPSPNDLTRQQLDELDALLQRMLSVPLAPADTPAPRAVAEADAPPLPPSWRIDQPAPAASASVPHLVLAEPPSSGALMPEPAPAEPTAPVAAPKPPAKAAPAPPPLPKPAPPAEPAPKPAPAPVATAPVSVPAPKPVAPTPVAVAPVPPAPATAEPPVPLPLWPLLALNAAFDAVCGLLGPPGRVLRSGFCKNVYGLIGFALLAYTLAHVALEQEWITLPFPLPWPR